ncbi:hypothetical protein CR513_26005, partial [Mucuna pruriens]
MPLQGNSPSLEDLMKQLAANNLEFQQSISSSNLQFQQNMNATIQDLKTQIGQLANTVSHSQSTKSSNLPSQTISNPRGNNEEFTVGAQALPKKCQDPKIFLVPCTIGECTFANAMLDLGASINVMLTSIYKSLNFGDLEPTRMTIQLANRSIVQPLGVLEDVLVQVNGLIFPADFYVLDMEDETSEKGSTLILGRPFLMTGRTKIDVHAETLSMEFGDTLVQFNIFEAMKHPTEDHSLFGIDLIDELVEEYFQIDNHSEDTDKFAERIDLIGCLGSISEEEANYAKSSEVHNLSDSVDNNNDIVDLDFEVELLKVLDQVCKLENLECSIEAEVQVAEIEKLFLAQLATIFTTKDELAKESRDRERIEVISAKKTMVKANLHVEMHAETISAKKDQKQARAAFILDNNVPSVSDLTQVSQLDPKAYNVNSSSSPPLIELKPLPSHFKYAYLDDHEDKLLKVLRQHKKVIGWKLSDLPGINPSICMHRILMEEAAKPIRQ